MSLALSLQGKPDEAAKWRERAIGMLKASTPETRKVAEILSAAEPTPVADLEPIYLELGDKALVFAVLAERFPASRDEYHAAAARFNVRRKPPYQLVLRAIEAGSKK